MSRCLAKCQIDEMNIKRCIREAHDTLDDTEHIWVEATAADETAMVVRWNGPGYYGVPREILIGKVVHRA